MTTTYEIQLRADTAANWSTDNPVLGAGEPGWDQTNGILKIGDGTTAWNSLVSKFVLLSATQTLANKTLTAPNVTAYDALYAGGNLTWMLGTFGNANYLGVESSDSGDAPDIFAGGTDSNIHVGITPKGTGRLQVSGVSVPTLTSTDTFTNKRITPRVTTINNPSATPTVATDSWDQINFTGMTVAITSLTSGLTGTPTDGQELTLRFKDNGTARAIAHGASFVAGPAALLITTVASKTHLAKYRWDSLASKWACILVHTAGY